MPEGLENENRLDKMREARVVPNQVREGRGSSVLLACTDVKEAPCARVAARGLSHTDPVPKQGHTGSLRAPARAPGAPGGTVCLPARLVDWDVST